LFILQPPIRLQSRKINLRSHFLKISRKSKIEPSKFWSKLENFLENRNFGQKWKFFSKIEIMVKNGNLLENRNFGQKSKFFSKIEILVNNRNFSRKSKFSPKIEILVKNRNFSRKSKFWSKIEFFFRFNTSVQGPNKFGWLHTSTVW